MMGEKNLQVESIFSVDHEETVDFFDLGPIIKKEKLEKTKQRKKVESLSDVDYEETDDFSDHGPITKKRKSAKTKPRKKKVESLSDVDYEETDDLSNHGSITKKRKLKKVKPKNMKRCPRLKGMNANKLWQILQEQGVIKFCQEMGLLAESVVCSCGSKMRLAPRSGSDGFLWTCRKGRAHTKKSTIRKGTIFEQSRLCVSEILWIMYMWLYDYSLTFMGQECDLQQKTISEWCTTCSDACQAILEFKSQPLGGDNKMVEVFECKYKIRKSTNQKSEREQWVFCALEQLSTKSLLIILPDKKTHTLLQVFDKYILPGSTIISRGWHPYKELNAGHFEYLTTVKSLSFYDSVTQKEMTTIDVFNKVTKRPPKGLNRWTKYEYDSNFCEYFYRKSLSSASDAYITFLKDITMVFKPLIQLPAEIKTEQNEE